MVSEKSCLVKAVTKDKMFRAYAINALEVVSTAQKSHDLWSTSAAALGRTLVASLLLSSAVLKGKETMTIRLNGKGLVGGMVIDANSKGEVKGYIANPHVNLPLTKDNKVDVARGVGKDGFLQVMKNYGSGEPYTSEVQLVSGKIGDDFTYYLAKSEQIPSALGVSVDINGNNKIVTAGGYLIQVMPGASEQAIIELESKLKNVPSISKMLTDNPNPVHILDAIFGTNNIDVLDELPISFTCNCSKEKFSKDLAGLGKAEIKDMLNKDHGASIVCNFCGNKYSFSESDLKDILKKI